MVSGRTKILLAGVNTANWFSAISKALSAQNSIDVWIAPNARLNENLFDTSHLKVCPQAQVYGATTDVQVKIRLDGFPVIANPDDCLNLSRLKEFDWVWIVSGISLLPGLIDIPLLRDLGIKVGFLWTGSEVRYSPASTDILLYYDIYPPARYVEDLVKDTNDGIEHFINDDIYRQTLFKKTYQIRIAEAFANAIINHPEQGALSIRSFYSFPMFHEINIPFSKPAKIPKIYARSTNPVAKGFKKFQQELSHLDDKVKSFHMQPVPQLQFFSEISQAVILFDDTSYPGGSAINCCALGRISLNGNSLPGTWSFAGWPYPTLEPNQMSEAVEKLLTLSATELEDLCYEGYLFSKKFTLSELRKQFIEILNRQTEPDITPTWFDENFTVKFNAENIPPWVQQFNANVASLCSPRKFKRAKTIGLFSTDHQPIENVVPKPGKMCYGYIVHVDKSDG